MPQVQSPVLQKPAQAKESLNFHILLSLCQPLRKLPFSVPYILLFFSICMCDMCVCTFIFFIYVGTCIWMSRIGVESPLITLLPSLLRWCLLIKPSACWWGYSCWPACSGDHLRLPSEAGVIGKLPAIPNINMGSRKVYPGPHCGISDVTIESFPSPYIYTRYLRDPKWFCAPAKILSLFDFCFLFI